jgi:ribosomal protein S6
MSETNTRLYELGFILVPTTPEVEVPAKVEALKTLIKGVGGNATAEGTPEYIDLAYTMERSVGSKKHKYSQGYFGFIKFETEPETLEVLKKALDADLDLVRYILLKTNPENTIVFKKPKMEAKRDNGVVDEEIIDDIEEVEDLSAHEALPELSADLDVPEEVVEEKEAE